MTKKLSPTMDVHLRRIAAAGPHGATAALATSGTLDALERKGFIRRGDRGGYVATVAGNWHVSRMALR